MIGIAKEIIFIFLGLNIIIFSAGYKLVKEIVNKF